MTQDIKYIIKRVIIGVLISIILMLIGSFKVNASTLIDLDLGNVVSFSCNNSWNISETANQVSGEYLRQVRKSMGCYIKRPGSDYNLIVIQPSFNLQYTNQFTNGDLSPYIYYNNSSLSYNTRVFLTYNNKTRYCQQEYTYAICDIGDIIPDIDQYIAIIIGFDFAFSSMTINANQLINGNMSISPLIQYAKLKDGNKASLSVIDDSINRMNDSINNMNDTIKDDTPPANEDLDSILNNKSNNNNVANLIMFVPNIFASVGSGLSSNCSGNIQLGNLMGTNLVLTCIRPQNYLGITLWTIIDFMFLFGLFLTFRKWVVNIYNDLTSLKEVQFN